MTEFQRFAIFRYICHFKDLQISLYVRNEEIGQHMLEVHVKNIRNKPCVQRTSMRLTFDV